MRSLKVVLVPVVLAIAAGAALAADPQGPAFGSNRFDASIHRVCAVADTDEYVAQLVAGERLNVSLQAPKGSTLIPRLTLIGPDGVEFTPPTLATKSTSRRVTLRRFTVPTSGRWTVRIAGQDATEGRYSVGFVVNAAPPVHVKRPIGNPKGDSFSFDGVEGASVDITVKWKSRRGTVGLQSIVDPAGSYVSGVKVKTTAGSLVVRDAVLHGGAGTYRVQLLRMESELDCDVSIQVRAQGRPASRKVTALPEDEVFLDVIDSPVRGIEGRMVRLTGGNFDVGSPPVVLFGKVRATAYVRGPATLDVIPPQLGVATTIAVSVIGSDGQSCVRDGYFEYVPVPTVDDLVDDRGISVRFVPGTGGLSLYLRGTGFEDGQHVAVGNVPVTSATALSPTRLEIVTPAASGSLGLSVTDAFGRTAVSWFHVEFLAAPTVATVLATGTAAADSGSVAPGGGAVVTVDGANFLASDVVSLGGVPCTPVSLDATRMILVAPSLPLGAADLTITDLLGQSVTVEKALAVVGYDDATSWRVPAPSALDDLSALRGAVGDLDGDGVADDVVLVSDGSSPGTRPGSTRLLLGNEGALVDVTGTALPAVRTDLAGVDTWRAAAVALGDLDSDGATDVLIAGAPVADVEGSFEARIFRNLGSGSFVVGSESPKVRVDPWTCWDGMTGDEFPAFTPDAPSGNATALAIGDLDGDGDDDVVLATDRFRTGTQHVADADLYVDGDWMYVYDASYQWSATGTTVDSPALRLFDNGIDAGEGLTDVSFTRLPRGESSPGFLPAFHARDVKLGDLDGDGDLDIVLTWDDPTSVTAYGRVHAGSDAPRIATRVLLNDGSGSFVDATDTWMPLASGNEYWQGDRLALADLDADGRLDLVLLHHESIDAFTGSTSHTRSALRVLRNNGNSFVEVSGASPSAPLAGSQDDDLRGTALAVLDCDGDGVLDLVVGTPQRLNGASGGNARSTRLLRGSGSLRFTDAHLFLPSLSVDSGDADELLLPDLDGSGSPTLLLLTEADPVRSAGMARLRALDWIR